LSLAHPEFWSLGIWSYDERASGFAELEFTRYSCRACEAIHHSIVEKEESVITDPCGRCNVRDGLQAGFGYTVLMDVERIIDEIQQLEEMFEAPDIRPLSASDVSAANRRHDVTLAQSPWFRLWHDFGVCCRPELSQSREGKIET
jgi:hypothetical protein